MNFNYYGNQENKKNMKLIIISKVTEYNVKFFYFTKIK